MPIVAVVDTGFINVTVFPSTSMAPNFLQNSGRLCINCKAQSRCGSSTRNQTTYDAGEGEIYDHCSGCGDEDPREAYPLVDAVMGK